MEKFKFAKSVMSKIAIFEEKKIKYSLLLSVPFLFFFLLATFFASYQIILGIFEQNLAEIVTGIEYDKDILFPLLSDNLFLLWEEIDKFPLLLFGVSSLSFGAILWNLNPLSLPCRIKEITKYK